MTKNKNSKYLLFLSFLITFLFISSSAVLALEVSYPRIPFLPVITSDSTLPAYIGYFFGILVSVAGILSLISFTMGAIGLISPNIESHNDAKDRMKGAVLGLILTVSAFIILRTINPVLVSPSLTPLGEVAGVFYTNGSTTAPAPLQESNTSNVPPGYNAIIYKCAANSYSPPLLIWEFPNTGLEDNNGDLGGVKVVIKNCGETEPINFGSFKMSFQTSGVYYFLGSNCNGYGSNANTNSQDNIANPFNGNIRSVRIVNDMASDLYYGAIFHKETNLTSGGECNLPIANSGTASQCINIINPGATSAADILTLNKNPGASGDGIALYSAPYGWASGANAGFANIPDTTILFPFYYITSKTITYDYTNVNRSNEYQTLCKTFQDCPGSIKIKGSYLIGLYSNYATAPYCQTFSKDAPNLNTEPIFASGVSQENSGIVYIIPTK